MVTLGEYPAMSLMQARAERDRQRLLLKAGADPAQVARTERQAKAEHAGNTFGAIAAELLAKRQKEGMGDGSVQRERRLVDKDLASISVLVRRVPVSKELLEFSIRQG